MSDPVIEPGKPIISLEESAAGYSIQVPVRNRGNMHDKVSGTVVVRSEEGQLVDRFSLMSGKGYILPEHIRVFPLEGNLQLPNGLYNALITLQTSVSRGKMSNTLPFLVKDGKIMISDITENLKNTVRKRSPGFIVSDHVVKKELRPGARLSIPIELRNLTKNTLNITLDKMQWKKDDSGFRSSCRKIRKND